MSRRFFQFRLSQLLLLFVLVSILFGLSASYFHRTYSDFALERRDRQLKRQLKQAQKDLKQAVIKDDLNLAKRALSLGFTAEQLISYQDPLLHICVNNGQIEMAELLLESGANANNLARIPMLATNSRPPKRSHFFIDAAPLLIAVRSAEPVETRRQMIRLLQKHAATPLAKNFLGDYEMGEAIKASDAEAADLLRECGVSYGVGEMAALNRLDQLKREVSKSPEVIHQRHKPNYPELPSYEPTLLGIALWRGYREMSMYLIDAGAPLDVLDHSGASLLHLAAHSGDPEFVRLLISRGLEVNARDDYGKRPIHRAAAAGHLAAVEALIAAGADVRALDDNKSSALYLAAVCDHPELLKPLLDAGADADEACRRLRADANPPNRASRHTEICTKMATLLEEMSKGREEGH